MKKAIFGGTKPHLGCFSTDQWETNDKPHRSNLESFGWENGADQKRRWNFGEQKQVIAKERMKLRTMSQVELLDSNNTQENFQIVGLKRVWNSEAHKETHEHTAQKISRISGKQKPILRRKTTPRHRSGLSVEETMNATLASSFRRL